MYKIRDWLYVGKYRELLTLDTLPAGQIGAVLQVLELGVDLDTVPTLQLDITDGRPLPAGALKRGVEFVRSQKAEGKNVLVACGAGISRSSTFAIAALKEEEDLDLLQAFREVCLRHPTAMPHPDLWESVCAYYNVKISIQRMLEEMSEIRRRTG